MALGVFAGGAYIPTYFVGMCAASGAHARNCNTKQAQSLKGEAAPHLFAGLPRATPKNSLAPWPCRANPAIAHIAKAPMYAPPGDGIQRKDQLHPLESGEGGFGPARAGLEMVQRE